jgi:hypothetical protein
MTAYSPAHRHGLWAPPLAFLTLAGSSRSCLCGCLPDRANHMGSSAGEGHDEAIERPTSKTTRSAARAKPLDS